MSLLDQAYGTAPGYSSAMVYGTPNPAIGGPDPASPGAAKPAGPTAPTMPAPTRATASPGRPLHDEPGAATAGKFSPATLLDNPATWLIVTIGLAIVAARYAATGKVW